MFQHILVPLDGTACSEQALPMAARIARASKAKITLMRIANIPLEYYAYANAYTPIFTQQILEVDETEAQKYLEKLRTTPALISIDVQTEVLQGQPTASILLENSKLINIDLIVMCSHGYTGMKRFVFGSIAQQIARHCSMPILVLNENQPDQTQTGKFPILVALDGTSRAETALAPAAMLSSILSTPQPGQIHLLRVVQPLATSMFTAKKTIETANEMALESAQTYLKAVAEKLRLGEPVNVPLQVSSSVCCDEDITHALLTTAEHQAEDRPLLSALAIATHGRSGVSRWLSGSITESLLGRAELPLLIVREHALEAEGADTHANKEAEAKTKKEVHSEPAQTPNSANVAPLKKEPTSSQKPFQRILVPLDGSERAEQALPVAAHIARTYGGSIVIMQAIAPSFSSTRYATGVTDEALAQTHHYLKLKTEQYDVSDLPITSQVFVGPPAEMIFTAAHLNESDLIVMCSHGETGFKRWIRGSVAQKVTRSSSVPVFVLYDGDQPLWQHTIGTHHPVRIMVPLDGSPLAEKVLAPAAYLSTCFSAPAPGSLHLVRIIHLPATFEYGQQDSVAEAIQQETPAAEEYLHTIAKRLHTGELAHLNLQVTTTVDHDLDIGTRLLKVATQSEAANACDVIALTTHGRSGFSRLMMGSVAEQLVNEAQLPIFVLHSTNTRTEQ
ncbi:MAG TPA: universal stress protein [Dictyobacter sp.]|jgi:nucleotide-binding universal stress UspA family protein|nr:universal stress protein [Dictyobacter sp.]